MSGNGPSWPLRASMCYGDMSDDGHAQTPVAVRNATAVRDTYGSENNDRS